MLTIEQVEICIGKYIDNEEKDKGIQKLAK